MSAENAMPLGGSAPGLRCARILDGNPAEMRDDDERRAAMCGQPAKWHIFWNDELDNGLACDLHFIEAIGWWWDAHPYDPVCSISGARLIPGSPFSHCEANLDDLAEVAEFEAVLS